MTSESVAYNLYSKFRFRTNSLKAVIPLKAVVPKLLCHLKGFVIVKNLLLHLQPFGQLAEQPARVLPGCAD